MITVGINREEEIHRFKVYGTFNEAREHCYPTATVVKAVNTYDHNLIGFIVMDTSEADFRRVTK